MIHVPKAAAIRFDDIKERWTLSALPNRCSCQTGSEWQSRQCSEYLVKDTWVNSEESTHELARYFLTRQPRISSSLMSSMSLDVELSKQRCHIVFELRKTHLALYGSTVSYWRLRNVVDLDILCLYMLCSVTTALSMGFSYFIFDSRSRSFDPPQTLSLRNTLSLLSKPPTCIPKGYQEQRINLSKTAIIMFPLNLLTNQAWQSSSWPLAISVLGTLLISLALRNYAGENINRICKHIWNEKALLPRAYKAVLLTCLASVVGSGLLTYALFTYTDLLKVWVAWLCVSVAIVSCMYLVWRLVATRVYKSKTFKQISRASTRFLRKRFAAVGLRVEPLKARRERDRATRRLAKILANDSIPSRHLMMQSFDMFDPLVAKGNATDIELQVLHDSVKLLEESCIVCRAAFQHEDMISKLPCGHFHHSSCIREWFKGSLTCCYCQTEFEFQLSLENPGLVSIGN